MGDRRTTWQSQAMERSFWPAWLSEPLPDVAVYTVGYKAPATGWGGEARGLIDRAQTIAALLFGANHDKLPTIFVCHSLGGLVAKEMLFQSATDPGRENAWVQKMTRGVAFLATPHAGSRLADWAAAMGWISDASESTRDLQTDSAYLQKLSSWYARETTALGIETIAFCETRNTVVSNRSFLSRAFNARVVKRESASPHVPGVRVTDVETDHIDIAKPTNRSSVVYTNVLRFIGDVLADVGEPDLSAGGKKALTVEPSQAPDAASDGLGVKEGRKVMTERVDPAVDHRPVLIHAEQDKTEVGKLRSQLDEHGYETWLKSVDILPGEVKVDKASKAIAKASLIIGCFSSKSVGQSGDFQKELRAALIAGARHPAGHIPLIPVRFDECELPALRFDAYGIDLHDLATADLFEPNGFERLVKAITLTLGRPDIQLDEMDIDDDAADQAKIDAEEAAARKREFDEQAERARSWFQDEVTSRLEDSIEALNELDRDGRASGLDIRTRAEALTSQLLDMTAEEALKLLSSAHQRLERSHSRAAAVCCDITLLILPAVYDPSAVQDVRDQITADGVYFVRLRARTELVADLVVAAATGRPIKLKSPDRDGAWPKGGALKLDLLPIVDRSGVATYLEAWDDYLWDKFGSDQLKLDKVERQQYLADELQDRARRRQPPDVYYIIMPEDEGKRGAFEEALSALAEKYPDLLILALDEDRKLDLEETRKFRPLRDMLFRRGRTV